MNLKFILSVFLITSSLLVSVSCNSSSSSEDGSMTINNQSDSLMFMSFYARATQDTMSAAYGMIMNKTNNDIKT